MTYRGWGYDISSLDLPYGRSDWKNRTAHDRTGKIIDTRLSRMFRQVPMALDGDVVTLEFPDPHLGIFCRGMIYSMKDQIRIESADYQKIRGIWRYRLGNEAIEANGR